MFQALQGAQQLRVAFLAGDATEDTDGDLTVRQSEFGPDVFAPARHALERFDVGAMMDDFNFIGRNAVPDVPVTDRLGDGDHTVVQGRHQEFAAESPLEREGQVPGHDGDWDTRQARRAGRHEGIPVRVDMDNVYGIPAIEAVVRPEA